MNSKHFVKKINEKERTKMKKLILILIGILMFAGCAMLDDLIKPEPVNPLIDNLRVTLSWAEEPVGHSCITTLDDKWVPKESWPELKEMLNNHTIQIAVVSRGIIGWNKDFMRVFGTKDRAMLDEMWAITEPIRDLIDLAIPAEETLTLEWWSTGRYRILFQDQTALNIDKMASYIDKLIAMASAPQANRRDKGGSKHDPKPWFISEWIDGKVNTTLAPESDGGPVGGPVIIAVGKGSGDRGPIGPFGPRPAMIVETEYLWPLPDRGISRGYSDWWPV
jgi:hypothetical protein